MHSICMLNFHFANCTPKHSRYNILISCPPNWKMILRWFKTWPHASGVQFDFLSLPGGLHSPSPLTLKPSNSGIAVKTRMCPIFCQPVATATCHGGEMLNVVMATGHHHHSERKARTDVYVVGCHEFPTPRGMTTFHREEEQRDSTWCAVSHFNSFAGWPRTGIHIWWLFRNLVSTAPPPPPLPFWNWERFSDFTVRPISGTAPVLR